MADTIIDVHSISSASGWYFRNGRYEEPDDLSDYEAVVCFALVSVLDSDLPELGPKKRLIALLRHDMNEIVGETIGESHTDVMFVPPK